MKNEGKNPPDRADFIFIKELDKSEVEGGETELVYCRGVASEPLKLAGSLQGTLGLPLPLQTQRLAVNIVSCTGAPRGSPTVIIYSFV